jgi:hypothetical protein
MLFFKIMIKIIFMVTRFLMTIIKSDFMIENLLAIK